MHRTKIEYLTHCWNPIVGCNGDGCAVRQKCWARAMAKRQKHNCLKHYLFIPHLHAERLDEPLRRKKPALIGTCFMGDFFDSAVKTQWQAQVLEVIDSAHWHAFLCLTKQPQNIPTWINYPKNFAIGVSVNTNEDLWRIKKLKQTKAIMKAVSFEPLYEELALYQEDLRDIDWVIIGGQTRPLILPDYEWVIGLMQLAGWNKIPIFLKNNLEPIMASYPLCQQYPRVGVTPQK